MEWSDTRANIHLKGRLERETIIIPYLEITIPVTFKAPEEFRDIEKDTINKLWALGFILERG